MHYPSTLALTARSFTIGQGPRFSPANSVTARRGNFGQKTQIRPSSALERRSELDGGVVKERCRFAMKMGSPRVTGASSFHKDQISTDHLEEGFTPPDILPAIQQVVLGSH